MRTDSKTFSSLNDSIRNLNSVQSEGIVQAVKNTVQRVKNARSGWGFKTNTQVAAKRAEQKARWDRNSAETAKSNLAAGRTRDGRQPERKPEPQTKRKPTSLEDPHSADSVTRERIMRRRGHI
jgi:hypothetical protein